MTAPALTLRPTMPADAAGLALLGGASFLESYAAQLPGDAIVAHCARHHTVHEWQGLLAAAGVWGLLAQEALGAPVGYALLTPPDIPGGREGDCEIRRLYVLSRYWGTGTGHALLQAVRGQAVHRGARRLILGVYTHNQRARAFYAREGFGQVATRRFTVGTLVCDDLVLAADL